LTTNHIRNTALSCKTTRSHRCKALYDFAALRMSLNVASARNDKQSLHSMVRSGLAGGIAGCVVSLPRALCDFIVLIE